jgi:hypothetical protein
MSDHFTKILVATMLALPVMARAADNAPLTTRDTEAKLQQQIKDLDAYAKSLEKRVAELSKRNDELELKLDTRPPQLRIVVPPGTLKQFTPPQTPAAPSPFIVPTPEPSRENWVPRGSGETFHYVIPTQQ